MVYDKILSKYRDKDITFVEIGVKDGGSLFFFKKYLPKAKIIGIDLNEDCKKFEKYGFNIEIGDQSSKEFWENFFIKYKKVDVVLDDGGHTNEQQINTVISCVPNIKDDGLLITEDVMCSYFKDFGNPNKYSFVNFSKKVIDDVNFKFPNIGKFNYSLNDHIYSIEFFESIIVFKINRNFCYSNSTINNNGKFLNHKDLRYDSTINKKLFKKPFLLKFKLFRKINELFIFYKMRIFNIYKSYKMKRYFK
tara:strand:+ start:316 stop:1062 length:747 start_codon:yes stop_codon:yes gene_type:complete